MADNNILTSPDCIHKNGGVEIMKASAGSGKTFSLAREYIRILLTDNKKDGRNSHRHILAVTFTNKATENMKSKIVEALDKIAREPSRCEYTGYLLKECGFRDEAELQKAAKVALNDLLNDYSAFSVSTIDKFFQKTLRAFSREMGLTSEYRVELDRESLVNESADSLLDSLSEEDGALLKYLSDSSIEQIESGKGYHLDNAVKEFASGYLSACFQKKIKKNGIDQQKAFSEGNIKKLSATCRDVVTRYDEGFSKAASELKKACDEASFHERLNGNFLKKVASFYSLKSQVPEAPGTQYWENAKNDVTTLIKKGRKKTEETFPQDELDRISDAIAAIDVYLDEEEIRIRKTAGMLFGQVYVFRIATALKKEFDALLQDKNVLGIDDTNEILKDIIDGSDAPFIYEKTGTWYRHFLLDEFQDTSDIQWECFIPLLKNSIAEGMYNLIVGDVKQSIYRWRDAEWKILGEEVEKTLAPTVTNPLRTNYRSSRNIIAFNNGFYKFLSEILEGDLNKDLSENTRNGQTKEVITRMYEDVEQEVSARKSTPEEDPGRVDVIFCDNCNVNAYIAHSIRQAISEGYDYKDIAILVRTKRIGAEIASYLAGEDTPEGIGKIPFITNDSLMVGSSESVRLVVAGLSFIDDPADKINSFMIKKEDSEEMIFNFEEMANARSLHDMADILLKQLPKNKVNEESLYILAFMDMIKDFCDNSGNSLHSFLSYWKESGKAKTISCPDSSNAVTIITIHKSKGLDFPYVIVPFKNNDLAFDTKHKNWYSYSKEGTPFADCENALYNVNLSKDSLFLDSYLEEEEQAFIDHINTWYVATTRAKNRMSIISRTADGKTKIGQTLYNYISYVNSDECRDGSRKFIKVNAPEDVIGLKEEDKGTECYLYCDPEENERFANPGAPDKKKEDREGLPNNIQLRFVPDVEVGSYGSVRISQDAADYFIGEGETSRRKKGLILHSIMENIRTPEDIEGSVGNAINRGLIKDEEKNEILDIIYNGVKPGIERGWFPEEKSKIKTECEIISQEQKAKRADRVVIDGNKVSIIDYKFGDESKAYDKQVRNYMRLFKEMGYQDVKGYLWYFEEGQIKEVYL